MTELNTAILLLFVSATIAAGCNETQSFPCDGDRCIPISWRCDGHTDCLDETDETSCEDIQQCPDISQFRCVNRRCIHQAWVCDGENDCGDSSDEANCSINTCEPGEFQCQTDQKCIPGRWRCDNAVDCLDRSDEKNCSTTVAPTITTTTSSTSGSDCSGLWCESDAVCINTSWICDGYMNCADGSDEKHCSTTTTSTTTTFSTTTTITTKVPTTQSDCEGFQCESDDMCVHSSWVCDNDADCPDGSDEENCSTPTSETAPTTTTTAVNELTTTAAFRCADSEFQCESDPSLCIYKAWRCDNDPDCPDQSDEKNCKSTTTSTTTTTSAVTTPTSIHVSSSPASLCSDGEFQCESDPDMCIHWSWQCDGDSDCSDSSDEKNCITTTSAAVSTTFTPSPASPTPASITPVEASGIPGNVEAQATSSPNQAINTTSSGGTRTTISTALPNAEQTSSTEQTSPIQHTSPTEQTSPTATSSSSVSPSADGSRKKGSMFYMLLMGFRAESEKKAISMFEMMKNLAKNATRGEIAFVGNAS